MAMISIREHILEVVGEFLDSELYSFTERCISSTAKKIIKYLKGEFGRDVGIACVSEIMDNEILEMNKKALKKYNVKIIDCSKASSRRKFISLVGRKLMKSSDNVFVPQNFKKDCILYWNMTAEIATDPNILENLLKKYVVKAIWEKADEKLDNTLIYFSIDPFKFNMYFNCEDTPEVYALMKLCSYSYRDLAEIIDSISVSQQIETKISKVPNDLNDGLKTWTKVDGLKVTVIVR